MADSDTARGVAVVTGAGSGIGRAVALQLSRRGVAVLAVGRRPGPLRETADLAPGPVTMVSADVATQTGRAAVEGAVAPSTAVRYLVHGAGVYPIAPIAELTIEAWRSALATNVEARLFLTTLMLAHMDAESRVLFIGSDSATRPRKAAAAYCVSKAASFMLEECLKLELAERSIRVANARPGLVATAMVEGVLNTDPAIMPDQAEFAAARDAGKLVDPVAVGRFFAWLLADVGESRFTACNWDIRDSVHHSEWLGDGSLYA